MKEQLRRRSGKSPRSARALFCGLFVAVFLPAHSSVAQAPEPDPQAVTVESLLKSGWQIAGYSDTADGWSAFILFRHPEQPYLVQCRAGYDVMREKRVRTNCYELR
jgi:hypothetical protein